MKDLDFLPEWYKDRRRRHSRMRRQYIALVAVFLMMMTFNLAATHRASRIAASVTHHAEEQMRAETVVHEFNLVTKELNQLKTKADLVNRIDTRFDVAAILAEISHIVGESVVLSKIDLLAEPFARAQDDGHAKGGSGRTGGRGPNAQTQTPLGNAKLRVVVAGVAIHPTDVADLVCRLDESSYFQQVRLSYSRTQTLIDSTRSTPSRGRTSDAAVEPLDGTVFEITCYLANYVETEGQ